MSSWPSWPSITNPFSSASSPSPPPPPPPLSAPSTIFNPATRPASRSNPPHDPNDLDVFLTHLTTLRDTFLSQPPLILAGTSCAAGGASILLLRRVYKHRFARIQNSDWVTPAVLRSRRRWVRGVVTKVGDADNFRMYHTPGPFWRWPLRLRHLPVTPKGLQDQTLHIRIAGVDAPEAPHFGKPGQDGAAMVLHWLTSQIHGKTVWVELYRKDQYNRVVGFPYLPHRVFPSRFKGRPLPLEMLRAGMGTTYIQAGSVYGPYTKEDFLAVELEAKTAQRGIWETLNGEHPSEYKKRVKEMTAEEADEEKKLVAAREVLVKERLEKTTKKKKGLFGR